MEHSNIPLYREDTIPKQPGRPYQPVHQNSLPLKIDPFGTDYRSDSIKNDYTTTVTSPESLNSSPISLMRANSYPSKPPLPPIKRKSIFWRWISRWVTDWWAIELICSFIAALSLIAIVTTLEFHKGRPLQEWSFWITLNTSISILATLGQMAMMTPVVECINQLKWLWYVKGEKLAGFQAFDDASRGPTGSLFLLAKFRRFHLVSLGAFITIASVTFGPFAQQVVSFPLHPHAFESATTPQVFNYTGAGDGAGFPSSEITASFYEGLALNSTLSNVTPSCSTGNCTWTQYSSLGICASVSDLSSSIKSNACDLKLFNEIFAAANTTNPGYPCFNYTLPEQAIVNVAGTAEHELSNASLSNGFLHGLYTGVDLMEVMALYSAVDQNTSLTIAYLMYQPGFTPTTKSNLPSPVAYQLTLDLCVQTYNTTVTNGLVNTTLLSSQILETDLQATLAPGSNTILYEGGNSYQTIAGDVFGMTAGALSVFKTMANGFLSSECFVVPNDNPLAFNGPSDAQMFCDDPSGVPFLDALEDDKDPMAAVTQRWNYLATSITNALRIGAGGDTQVGNYPGIAFAPVIFVETEYRWLILPVALVTFTLIFLLATMWKSRRLGTRVWKSSNIAVLQGLDADLCSQLGGLGSVSEMEERAEEVKVRFDVSGEKAGQGFEYRLVQWK